MRSVEKKKTIQAIRTTLCMETKLFLTCIYSLCSLLQLFCKLVHQQDIIQVQQLGNRCISCPSIKDCHGKQSGQSEERARNRPAHKEEKASLKKAKDNYNKVLFPRFALSLSPLSLSLSFPLSLAHTHTHTHTRTLSLSFSLSGGSSPC